MKKPDYKNWVPKSMVIGLGAATAASASLSVLFGSTESILKGRPRQIAAAAFGAATPVLLFYTGWMGALHITFDYNGKRKLAKTIVDGWSSTGRRARTTCWSNSSSMRMKPPFP